MVTLFGRTCDSGCEINVNKMSEISTEASAVDQDDGYTWRHDLLTQLILLAPGEQRGCAQLLLRPRGEGQPVPAALLLAAAGVWCPQSVRQPYDDDVILYVSKLVRLLV